MVSMMGYKTKRVLFHVPQDYGKKLEIGDIYLFQEQKALEEVTVAATKLKIYHSGDTLVYNADAFVLDKQNVLEDLVKMLPGVELRDGRVFANRTICRKHHNQWKRCYAKRSHATYENVASLYRRQVKILRPTRRKKQNDG